MKGWLIFGTVSGLALGGYLATTAQGLELVDGLLIGWGAGLVSAIGLASIPWRHMAKKEW